MSRPWLLTLVLAVLACSPAAQEPATVATQAAEQEPAVPGAGKLVVTGPEGSVSIVDPEGGGPRLLTDSGAPGVTVQATPSIDGGLVVWTEIVDGEPHVATYDGDDVSRSPLPTAPYFYMFSPDGSRVAALGNDPGDDGLGGGEGVALVMIDLGAGSAEVVDAGQPYFLAWRPDSSGLAAHIGPDVLTVVDPTGDRSDLDAAPGLFQAPEWIDDDRFVAVTTIEGATAYSGPVALQAEVASLVVVDVSDGSSELIARVDSAVSFELSPDRSRVAYVDGVGGGGTTLGALVVRPVSGDGEPVEVADDGVVAFEWSPDGSALLFLTLDRENGLVPHVWDGARVTIYAGFLPTPTFLTQYLPFWAQYTRTITQWAPDGSAFAYAATDDAAAGQVWVQAVVGDRRMVSPGEMVVWSR